MESKSSAPSLEMIVLLVVIVTVFGWATYSRHAANAQQHKEWSEWLDRPAESRELSDVLAACQLAEHLVPENVARQLTNGGARALAAQCSNGGKSRGAAREQEDREELIKALARVPSPSTGNSADQAPANK